jgi:DNA-binding NtrC family response regulator
MGIVTEREIEVILLDLTMPHLSGDELLAQIYERYPQIPVIIVTGTNEVKAAVECMKAGAFDYMVKAVEESRLVSGVKKALEIRALRRQYHVLRSKLLGRELAHPEAFERIVTRSDAMKSIFLLVEAVARTSEPILIVGETGTGKELIAEAIHEASGRNGALVRVNVAGLDDTMFADTLFGHKRGAFTGAMDAREGLIGSAAEGTLFLDEIGDLATASQVKLLRLLDSRDYYPLGSDLAKKTDARIIAATNHDIASLQESGRFRKDLYYRLTTYAIQLPPLRERREDLPLLLHHFLEEASAKLGREKPSVPQAVYPLLGMYPFPGNIRELRAVIFDAVTRQSGPTLSLAPIKEAFGLTGRSLTGKKMPEDRPDSLLEFSERLPTIKQATEMLIDEALRRSEGIQTQAAFLLGISHQALSKRLQRRKAGGS